MWISALPGAIALAALSGSSPAFGLDRHDIQGVWQTPDAGLLVEVYSCDGGICAKIASTPEPNLKDVKNPDPSLRARPVAGLVTWRRPKEAGDLQWIGTSYNIADGGTYYGTMRLTGPATLALSICNLAVMHCADQTWTKAATQPAATILTPVSHPKAAPVVPVQTPPAEIPTSLQTSQQQPPASNPVIPKPAAVKPKRAPAKNAEKPTAPPGAAIEKPKEAPERQADPHGYDDLPHIHVR
jgi:uncharacterized protein (DUF2147 family)